MRQAWEIANKKLETLEKAKNYEVQRNKNRKQLMATPASQGSAPENPLTSEGAVDANPPMERTEGNLGREDPVIEAGEIPPNVTTGLPAPAESLLPEARAIPPMERTEDTSVGANYPLPGARDGHSQGRGSRVAPPSLSLSLGTSRTIVRRGHP